MQYHVQTFCMSFFSQTNLLFLPWHQLCPLQPWAESLPWACVVSLSFPWTLSFACHGCCRGCHSPSERGQQHGLRQLRTLASAALHARPEESHRSHGRKACVENGCILSLVVSFSAPRHPRLASRTVMLYVLGPRDMVLHLKAYVTLGLSSFCYFSVTCIVL